MSYVLVHHEVRDYDTWRESHDGNVEAREKAGLKDLHIFQSATDPQDVFILFEASDLKKAQELGESDELRETMRKSGVISKPEVYFLSEGGQ